MLVPHCALKETIMGLCELCWAGYIGTGLGWKFSVKTENLVFDEIKIFRESVFFPQKLSIFCQIIKNLANFLIFSILPTNWKEKKVKLSMALPIPHFPTSSDSNPITPSLKLLLLCCSSIYILTSTTVNERRFRTACVLAFNFPINKKNFRILVMKYIGNGSLPPCSTKYFWEVFLHSIRSC